MFKVIYEKKQMNVKNLLKVNNKDTRTKPVTVSLIVFSFSIVGFEQVKNGYVVKELCISGYISKKDKLI